jgi:hypothetical protein
VRDGFALFEGLVLVGFLDDFDEVFEGVLGFFDFELDFVVGFVGFEEEVFGADEEGLVEEEPGFFFIGGEVLFVEVEVVKLVDVHVDGGLVHEFHD